MNIDQCRGDWGLVTGASSGIGREFCYQLAESGLNLVLLARRKPALEALAAELSARHGTQSLPLVIDLRAADAGRQIKTYLSEKGIRVRLLCNNAASAPSGPFEGVSAETYQEVLQVNVAAAVSLCRHLLPDLSSFPTSAIINVSSPAAIQPVPYLAVYAASKAFLSSFSQALYGEWRDRGVLVQTLLPGPVRTDLAQPYGEIVKKWDSAAETVRRSLKHLADGAPLVTAARGTYAQRVFAGLFPAKTVISNVERMFRPLKRQRSP